MGRSELQGTPWHYEYAKGKGINNSKNCAFNTGERCACRISPNHNRTCVGKSNCDEFERSSFRKTNINKSADKIISTSPKSQDHKKNTVKHSSVMTVQLGDSIVVSSLVTDEEIEIKISDRKNPFYSKALNDMISIKGEKYKIIKINNP